MHSLYSVLPPPKPDPLFAIAAEAQAAGKSAINGTIGVYMDEDGKVLVFPSVRAALRDLGDTIETYNCSYPPLTGLPSFRSSVTKLLIGDRRDVVASIASTAGTGALAIDLRLMKMMLDRPSPLAYRQAGLTPHPQGEGKRIILPAPAWANHLPVCKWAGLEVVEVPYIIDGRASIDGIAVAVKAEKSSFGLLLQVGCHNPTGLDLSDDQWLELIDHLKGRPCIVLLDFAYQGFKGTPEEDRSIIGRFVDAGIATLVTWSASKNHSIYGLRTGLAAAFVKDEAEKALVEGTYSNITRGLHSAAPTFGQAVVALVQEKYQQQWISDLASARATLKRKRELLLKHLPASFSSSLTGYGMFAVLPLSEAQVTELKVTHNVFLPLDGRINIAGIPEARIGELCQKIESVL